MAGTIGGSYDLQPSSVKATLQSNYITNFNFLSQYLPDTYEQEFARYGDRSVSSFLRRMGAEIPSNSDLIKWTEEGRLHTKYVGVTTTGAVSSGLQTFDIGTGTCVFRIGQTVMLSSASVNKLEKGIITALPTADTFTVAYYSNAVTVGFANPTADIIAFVYGSEFKKGANGMSGSLDADLDIFEVSPVIIKDKFAIAGSDMAQIGWVEVTTENGATGYLWYLKSEHETRLRFEDYLETAMIEAVPAENGSGVANASLNPLYGNKGSEGIFYVVNNRGNVWGGGNPTTLADFDSIISRLDKQGSIEENVIFVNRAFSFDIDDMLAAQNSYGAGGTSYGLFDNDEKMALNLGFTGFRRGYDFYKSDWKYLNDPTMRGGLNTTAATATGTITGLMVPAGSTSVYDQIMGKNAKRPFLHVRYRASEAEDRRYKTWITGSAGGAATSDLDAMEVNFLSERCVCTLGANNFVLFRYG